MSRFDVVSRFEVPPAPPTTCVIYCVWDRPGFLGFLRASLLSQSALTDVERVDVKVFVEGGLLAEARRVLRGFRLELIELCVPYEAYSELLHPSLATYERVVRVDADAYFVGRRRPIYASLESIEADVATGWNHFPPGATLRARQDLSRLFRGADADGYLDALASCVGATRERVVTGVEAGRWCYAVLQVFGGDLLRDEPWRNFVREAGRRLGTTCHETLLLTWLAIHPRPVADLAHVPGFRISVYDAPQRVTNPGRDLVLLHPLREHGDRFLEAVLRHVVEGDPVSEWEALRASWRIRRRRWRRALRGLRLARAPDYAGRRSARR